MKLNIREAVDVETWNISKERLASSLKLHRAKQLLVESFQQVEQVWPKNPLTGPSAYDNEDFHL